MPVDLTKLFAQSEVCLFGWLIGQPPPTQEESAVRVLDGPTFPPSFLLKGHHATRGNQPSDHGPLRNLFSNGAWLASIHAFSCEGRYTQFRTPALFLVTDLGELVWDDGKLRPERFGLPHLDRNIEFASDLRFWTYDRGAHTVRLDMSAGTVQRLVIDVEAGGAQGRRIDLVGQESTFMGRLAAGN